MRKLFSTLIPLLKDACGSLHGALAQALEEKQTEDIPELERQIVVLEQKKKKLLDGMDEQRGIRQRLSGYA